MAYPYDQTKYPFPTQPWDLDIRDWNATGDGTTDDSASIQAALNAAEMYGGGIVYFPPGTYLISSTIQLPSKVYIRGVAGTTYNDIDENPSDFLTNVNTIIKLMDDAPGGISMIEPKTPDNFNSSGIESLILFGNRDKQEELGNIGIHVPDLLGVPPQRSQAQFRNVLIFQVKGVGFYGGVGQHELFLDWVTVFDCDSDGYVLRGEDLKGNRIAAGKNKGAGIKFPGSGSPTIGSGSGRFFDVDCWGNTVGMEISDTMGYVFFQVQCNLNKREGLRVYSTVPEPPGFVPGNIRLFRGRFSENSVELDGGYSDIKLDPNVAGYSPYDIALIGCEFHGTTAAPMAKYVIEDTSPNPRRCIVSAGLFKSANYKEGFSNRPQALRDCFDYHTGDLLSEAEINYKWFDGDHAVSLGDGFIAIDAGLGPRNVILPPLVEMAVGRIFYIAKTDPTSNAVTVSAQPEEEINGGAPVTLVSPREAFMIVHAGTAWLGFKIA